MREHPVVLITGGSRGVGSAAALAFARRGYDVAITYRNKAARAREVARAIEQCGSRGLAVACDLTDATNLEHLFEVLQNWRGSLDVLVLNASGGMERDLITADPGYPLRINRDAQLTTVDRALPLMRPGSTLVFVTSHWAHLHGRVPQLPRYEPVAASKHAGEMALRAQQDALADRGIRLLVVTGDMIDGTITVKLMERAAPGLTDGRREEVGELPTTEEMGEAIAAATEDCSLPVGATVVVGGPLESLVSAVDGGD